MDLIVRCQQPFFKNFTLTLTLNFPVLVCLTKPSELIGLFCHLFFLYNHIDMVIAMRFLLSVDISFFGIGDFQDQACFLFFSRKFRWV